MRGPYQLAGTIFFALLFLRSIFTPHPNSAANNAHNAALQSRLAPPGTAYMGRPWHNERTIAVDTLGETKFARCDVHTVLSEDGQSVINDWMFLEEVDAVNVVVQNDEDNFVVFQQQKYGIPGVTLSPVGGMIDDGESPLTAAKREVLEELGLGSRRTLRDVRDVHPNYNNGRSGHPQKNLNVRTISHLLRTQFQKDHPPLVDEYNLLDGEQPKVVPSSYEYDADWVYLGRYRTAANRGGGFLYSFLLKKAVPLLPGGGTPAYKVTGEEESQELLYLNEGEVMRAVSENRFGEVKWVATFALALLHLRDGMPACCDGPLNEQLQGRN
eukprot:CAMPEP_0183714870 /NCGR_PEP_ID=MMETSP0737-20130205/9287_1 /TAXON_ID=385413 /ORGANISM="Thalassiosira miniscula, Strain CCMP1093" /LENGTH=326 /DNA_ID=CAMNT_0025943893 /DNA_START=157 /DNA_END=1137 /DNA_ORIENTATION=-